jgi:hypothetical protein
MNEFLGLAHFPHCITLQRYAAVAKAALNDAMLRRAITIGGSGWRRYNG